MCVKVYVTGNLSSTTVRFGCMIVVNKVGPEQNCSFKNLLHLENMPAYDHVGDTGQNGQAC